MLSLVSSKSPQYILNVQGHHFTFDDKFGISKRTIQMIVKQVANQTGSSKQVTPHVFKHTYSVNCIKKCEK